MATLKELRERAKLTQMEAAEMIGVSRSTISSWEIERAFPRRSKFYCIAEAYGCTVKTLLNVEKK